MPSALRRSTAASAPLVFGLWMLGPGAAPAVAQQFPVCPLPGRIGPDLIVGDIQGVANYTAVGNLEALALGTVACNVGTEWVNWIANTSQHPLIGGALYRYEVVDGAGRFEQLGQSWLKHAFFAASADLCCSNCAPTDGTHLGVGCSDPYAPARNGQQFGLGPKWQVGAHGGTYPYPPTHPTGGNNGRIQVDVADLESTGQPGSARYFGEAHYVAPDDCRANNNDNNASWRELSCTGSGTTWDFAPLGSTVRMQTAIELWPTLESGVTLIEVPAYEGTPPPLDGNSRMILGFKVTDLGNGRWHYEYALHNMNSDVAVRLLRVPVGAGVTLTNIGFHDVAYRGGDGPGSIDFDGTDWPASVFPGEITWSTQAFLQNTRANALRWGTTYNFRFDADAPPAPGTLTLAHYRGTATTVVPGVDVPSLPEPGVAFCAGDGLPGSAPCPCANSGAPGHGCANSANAAGARLAGGGITSPDGVHLLATGMVSSGTCMLVTGGELAGGAPFGDGVLCLVTPLLRLGQSSILAGAAEFPGPADPDLSIAGGTPPGSGLVGRYQVVYRNAAAAFCPPETFNVTHGYRIAW